MLAGCQPKMASKLQGRWELDESKSLATRMLGPDSKLPGGDLIDSAAQGLADRARVSMVVEFGRGGKLTTETNVMGETSTKNGTWKLVEHTENTAKVEFVLDEYEAQTITVRFEDDDTIEMVPPNLAVLERKLMFKRRQP